MLELSSRGWPEGQFLGQGRARKDGDLGIFQGRADVVEDRGVEQVLVDQEGLHRVAGRRVVGLRIPDNLHEIFA